MKQKLIVTKYNDGSLIRTKDGSERSSIYVTCNLFVNNNGSIWEQKRVAHIQMPVSLAESLNPQDGEDLNVKLKQANLGEYHIVMVETLEPTYEGQEPKTRGEGGDIITDDNGNPIFQDYFAVPISSGREDEKIMRTLTPVATTATEGVATTAEEVAA